MKFYAAGKDYQQEGQKMSARKQFFGFLFSIIVLPVVLMRVDILRRRSAPVAVVPTLPNVNLSNGSGIIPVSTPLAQPASPYKFAFSVGWPASGYTQVAPTSIYSRACGYGFAEMTDFVAIDRDTADPLHRYFIGSSKSFTFCVDVPNGNYAVTVILGDAADSSATTIKAGFGRIMRDKVITAAGQFSEQTFTVNVADEQLKLQFTWTAPKIVALEIEKVSATTLFLAGDSTVCDQPPLSDPYCSYGGWGQMLTTYFKPGVAVANYAASGRTSTSFIAEGRLEDILRVIKSGDYLFIQFGHNDEHAGTGIGPFTTYKAALQKYIDGARQQQAIPILLTPVARRRFDQHGVLVDTHGNYARAVRQLAVAQSVLLIDLSALSMAYFQALGPEGTKSVLFFLAAGASPDFPNEVADNTHFQVDGAMKIAGLVADAIRAQNIQPLASHLI